MSFNLNDLLTHLRVQAYSENGFRGMNLPGKRKAVYGGQVAAQALSAAINTTDSDRLPHSLHCHFLRSGNIDTPIDYQVVRVRDGGSFSLRQVTALQNNKPIFLATVSLQKPESGLNHQQPAPEMVSRDTMISEREFWEQVQKERPDLHYLRPEGFTALDILSNFRTGIFNPSPQEPRQSFWVRANGSISQASDHLLILAFQSDLQFLNTALHAHPYTLLHPDVQAASLDHCLWFYGNIDATQWLYYDMHSPVSACARGLNHGFFYSEEGKLIASTAQEGLMRVRQP